jgi:hypothetical protein
VREVDAVVRRARLFSDHHDAKGPAEIELANGLAEAVAHHAAADDHQGPAYRRNGVVHVQRQAYPAWISRSFLGR